MSEVVPDIPLTLRGGMAILNPLAGAPGTLGFVAADDHGVQWIVSCYHVLIRSLRPPNQVFDKDEPVFHLHPLHGNVKIAETDPIRASFDMDCAAARIIPGVVPTTELEGLGIVKEPCDPTPGMLVVKMGRQTGISKGKITDLLPKGRIRIELRDGGIFPNTLSEPGDSGALWVEEGSFRAVALHQVGNKQGTEFAIARNIQDVLTALKLKLWVTGTPGSSTPIVS